MQRVAGWHVQSFQISFNLQLKPQRPQFHCHKHRILVLTNISSILIKFLAFRLSCASQQSVSFCNVGFDAFGSILSHLVDPFNTEYLA